MGPLAALAGGAGAAGAAGAGATAATAASTLLPTIGAPIVGLTTGAGATGAAAGGLSKLLTGGLIKNAGLGASLIGSGLQAGSVSAQAGASESQIEKNAREEQKALRTQQRADFGSMLAQSGQTGLSQSSFSEIFTNQAMEDGKRMAQLKQQEQNRLAQVKGSKRGALAGLGVKAAPILGKGVKVLGGAIAKRLG